MFEKGKYLIAGAAVLALTACETPGERAIRKAESAAMDSCERIQNEHMRAYVTNFLSEVVDSADRNDPTSKTLHFIKNVHEKCTWSLEAEARARAT